MVRRLKGVQILNCAVVIFIALCAALFSNTSLALADDKEAAKPAPVPDWRAIFQIHYTQRVDEFRHENELFQNVILVGDSITEGFEVAKYLPGRRVINRGIGADVIGNELKPDDKRGVLKRIDESFLNLPATDAFLLIGINDLGDNHTPDQIEAGYREILEKVKKGAPRLKVHVQSLLPTRGIYAKHKDNVNDINGRLQKLATEFGYDYIDLHSLLADDKGDLKQELTVDGLHINADGYKIWKAEVEKKMGW